MTADDWRAQPGAGLVRVAGVATVGFAVVQIVAAALPRKPVLAVSIVVSLILFVVGCVAFLGAYAVAVGRSRDEVVTLPGVFFLADAPAAVRRRFLGALGVQVAVALATAAVRPFTPLAFGILVPMFGLGLGGLWAARHAEFEPVVKRRKKRPAKQGAKPRTTPRTEPPPKRKWYEPVALDEESPARPRRR